MNSCFAISFNLFGNYPSIALVRFCALGKQLLFIILLITTYSAFAYEGKSILDDTISLKEIVITEKAFKKTGRQSFSNLGDFNGRRMTNLLNDVSSIYLKNYGNGQLTSIAVRGTSAAQTEVLWNGIRINSPMLGQSDLALLNVGFHNSIALQYNQLNSAIGCNLSLNNQPIDSGLHFNGVMRSGSFGLFETNMNMQYSNGKLGGATKVALLRADNNYPILKDGIEQKQTHADVLQFGIFQEFNATLKRNHTLAAFLWWNQAMRDIPPTLQQSGSNAVQHDKAGRAMLYWTWHKNQLKLDFTTAYLHEQLRYKNQQLLTDDNSITNVVRNKFSASYKYKGLTVEGNLTADYEHASSAGYMTNHHRGLGGISVRASYFIKQGILFQLGARQELMNSRFSPFMPYASVGYAQWFGSNNIAVEVTGKRSFRFPTLNDLYWQGSGNSNLKPEDSWNTELSLTYQYDKWLSIAISNYYIWVGEQIQWSPDEFGRWTPQNLKAVFSRGIEVNQGFTLPASIVKNLTLYTNLSYAYTITTIVSSTTNADNSIGKQLIYVPRNRLSAMLVIGYKGFAVSPIFRYTGIRFTSSDNQDFLPVYHTLDVEASKTFNIKQSSIKLLFRVNNIYNTNYQDIAQRPLPRRNFEGTISFNLKQ